MGSSLLAASTEIVDTWSHKASQQKLLIAMSPALARAARALLGMTQSELAQAAGLGLSTIVDFEKERRQVSNEATIAIRAALERAGIEFICENGGGEGIRRRKNS